MVLRAINPPKLMNGTRCVVTKTMPNIMEAQITCEPYKHEKDLIPCIALQPSDTVLPFTFKPKQFPLRPYFALTVNKKQGRSLQVVGLDLTAPVFSQDIFMLHYRVLGKGMQFAFWHLGSAHEMLSTQKFSIPTVPNNRL